MPSKMFDILKSFKSLIKLEQIRTDNNVFKLHYKVTVIMLLAFSILLTSKQYFGDPIICDVEDKELLNVFCWIYGTFIIKNTLNDKRLPGLGIESLDDPSNVNKLLYYQWVCIVFCAQALMFYLPRYLWKAWESGRLRLLLSDFSGPVPSPKWNNVAKDNLIHYMLNGRGVHNMYALRFCFCEILNFLNVIAQIYFMDWFITGNFSVYGIAYATYHLNPMTSVFPKMTKCTYYKYGPSGTVMNHDALCILPLNILNEKFFLVLWYWLFFLLFVSLCALIYRVLFLTMPEFRVYLLRAQTRSFERNKAQAIVKYLTYGDFFVLYRIGKNINPSMYKELVVGMYESIDNKGKIYPQVVGQV